MNFTHSTSQFCKFHDHFFSVRSSQLNLSLWSPRRDAGGFDCLLYRLILIIVTIVEGSGPSNSRLRNGEIYHINQIKICAEFRLQRKTLINDPDMHHGTCVTHVPWCISGSLTRGDEENVPGIPDACTTHNFTYLAKGPSYLAFVRSLPNRIMSEQHVPVLCINLGLYYTYTKCYT